MCFFFFRTRRNGGCSGNFIRKEKKEATFLRNKPLNKEKTTEQVIEKAKGKYFFNIAYKITIIIDSGKPESIMIVNDCVAM